MKAITSLVEICEVILTAVVYKGEDLPLAIFKNSVDAYKYALTFCPTEIEIIEYILKVNGITKLELQQKGYIIK